jgi:hypothetical protein
MIGKAVLGLAFTLAARVQLLKLQRSPMRTHVASRARVVKEVEKHFAPETLAPLLFVDETTEGARCLSERGRGAGIAEKSREDNDIFDEFRRERKKRSREERHVPVADAN